MAQPGNERLIGEFVVEAGEHLAAIEPDLLSLETQGAACDSETIHRIFRALHSVKGGAGLLGLERINRLSHAMEALIMRCRDGELTPDAMMIDTLLAGMDGLQAMLADIWNSNDFPCQDLIERLQTFLSPEPAAAPASAGAEAARFSPFTAGEIEEAATRAPDQTLCWVRLELAAEADGRPVQPVAVLAEMDSIGEILAGRLVWQGMHDLADCLEGRAELHLLYATMMEAEHVGPILEIPAAWVAEPVPAAEQGPEEPPAATGIASGPDPEVKPDAAPEVKAEAKEGSTAMPVRTEPPPPAANKPSPPPQTPQAADTIRVRVDLLNTMMNLASELVLSRNQLLHALEGEAGRPGSLNQVLQNLNLVTSSLQEQIMQTRMQPVGNVLAKIPRLVRSLAQKTGKNVQMEITGSEVELDKSLIEGLSDPLTHLIRNCCDHGLEPPEERQAAGKPTTGTIHIRAYHEAGLVNIAINDDGQGIDPAKVVNKAVAKGLLPAVAAERLSAQEQLQLIFQPGLSTAEQVSDISGRGVGMDVVRSNIEKLGGHVELDSAPGRGTTVVLKLPLTLAIIPSLIVRAADQRFAIPQVNLLELVRVPRADFNGQVEQIGGREVLRLRHGLLPLVSLREILQMEPAAAEEEINILVLRVGPNRYGLVVDEVFQVVEIVVKPLSSHLQSIKCFAGATILDDGRVAMILDAMGIALQAQLRFGELQAEAAARRHLPEPAADRGQVLLFTSHPEEIFAISLADIARLEPVDFSRIQRIGAREVLDHNGTVLPVVRLDDYLPVRPLPEGQKEGFLIIPKGGDAKAGLLASAILDSACTDSPPERETFAVPGMAGSGVVNGRVTVFLDPAELLSGSSGRDLAWDAYHEG